MSICLLNCKILRYQTIDSSEEYLRNFYLLRNIFELLQNFPVIPKASGDCVASGKNPLTCKIKAKHKTFVENFLHLEPKQFSTVFMSLSNNCKITKSKVGATLLGSLITLFPYLDMNFDCTMFTFAVCLISF